MSEWKLPILVVVFCLCLTGPVSVCAAPKEPLKSDFAPREVEKQWFRFPGGPLLVMDPSILLIPVKPLESLTSLPVPFEVSDDELESSLAWIEPSPANSESELAKLKQPVGTENRYESIDYLSMFISRRDFQVPMVTGGSLAMKQWRFSTLYAVAVAGRLAEDHQHVEFDPDYQTHWHHRRLIQIKRQWPVSEEWSLLQEFSKIRSVFGCGCVNLTNPDWSRPASDGMSSVKSRKDRPIATSFIQNHTLISDGADIQQIDRWLRPFSSRIGTATTTVCRSDWNPFCISFDVPYDTPVWHTWHWRFYQLGEVTWAFAFHQSGILYAVENLGSMPAWPREIRLVKSSLRDSPYSEYERLLARRFPCFERGETEAIHTDTLPESSDNPSEPKAGFQFQYQFVESLVTTTISISCDFGQTRAPAPNLSVLEAKGNSTQ